MRKPILAVVVTFVTIQVVPFIVYGAMSAISGLEPTGVANPGLFIAGVAISKLGTAIAFATLYWVVLDTMGRRWFLYAIPWWTMFVATELGEALGTDYTWMEAIGGIISETVYTPLASYVTCRILLK